MSELVIVVQDAQRGDGCSLVSCFTSPEEAASHIEASIQAGCPREAITVYLGNRVEMQVHHRPVVSLVGAKAAPSGSPARDGNPSATEEPEAMPSFLAKYYTPRPA